MFFIVNIRQIWYNDIAMKKIIALVLTIFAITICCGCAGNSSADPYEATHTGSIILEDGRTISFELYGNAAPKSVENFVNLCDDGFYDGITFHRVVENFVIQAGDPTATGTGGSDVAVKGEFSANGVENPISHKRGVISMARAQNPNSASSQFFICHADAEFLDGEYAAFGYVTEGMDVVDRIAGEPTDFRDKPIHDVKMKKVSLI